jgi:iron complex outermembrane recepter protein
MHIRFRGTINLALVGLLAGTCPLGRAADASGDQGVESGARLEEVVVTGTSIRGTQPVGSNLITVDREAIAETGSQTLQQILATVPAVTGFGNAAQGNFGSADASGTFAPTIHGLGASASNGTLVLIDGHRLPLSGINHTLADPNVIAPLTIERVEVLPDGASSTYGSDAVAGVINFITRRNFKGVEVAGQYGFGRQFNTQDAGFLWGDASEASSEMVSYNYSRRSAISNQDRPFTRANHIPQGGGNFATFNCAPASVQPAGSTLVYASPYTGAGVTNNSNNGFCDFSNVADLLPEEIRQNVLVKLTHDIGDRVTFNADIVYSKEQNTAAISRGAVTVTAYGPGSTPPAGAGQINPFFQGPPGVTSETVRFDADSLLGPGARNRAGAETFMGTGGLAFNIAGDWFANLGFTVGKNDSSLEVDGGLCTSCANLALNGTTNTTGSPTTPSVAGTNVAVTNFPLTAANALDVWNPVGSNLTAASILQQLTDSTTSQTAHQTLKNVTLKFDGSLFPLPGGSAKAAIGGEYLNYNLAQVVIRSRNTGPSSTNSATTFLDYGRNVKSGYAELLLPLLGGPSAIPFVHRLDLNVAGRYDDYNDFGSTSNPKIALTWDLSPGVSVRGNCAKSFTAPALTSRGNASGITAESNYIGSFPGVGGNVVSNLVIPNTYPGANLLPAGACSAATGTCTIGTAAVTGLQVNGGNKGLKPERGNSWSVGLDLKPSAIPGFRASFTFWNADYTGMITAPQPVFAVGSVALRSLLTLGPTPAQVAAAEAGLPQGSLLPANIYYIYSFQQQNALNLKAEGIDFDVAYSLETKAGTFLADVAGSRKLKMRQQFGDGGEWFDVLNTVGINTTFPSNKFAARLNLGYQRAAWSANVFVNYAGSYSNWNGSAPFTVLRDAAFSPIGGGQSIPSFTTVDAHLAYHLEDSSGVLANAEIDLDGSNLFNRDPPFFNAALGYDPFNASPIGRLITLGVSKKW